MQIRAGTRTSQETVEGKNEVTIEKATLPSDFVLFEIYSVVVLFRFFVAFGTSQNPLPILFYHLFKQS
jgi:hypothetical protein